VASSLRDTGERLETILSDPLRYIEIETAIANRALNQKIASSANAALPFSPPVGCAWMPQAPIQSTPKPVPADTPELVRNALTTAHEGLLQAQELIEETISFATRQKTSRTKQEAGPGRKAAGRTADEALYDFVAIIGSQYWKYAANPKPPSVDRAGLPEKDTELVHLLDACLRPIDIYYEAPGVVSLWYRVKETMPDDWPERERRS
jgi:hypothetical protein